MPGQKWTPAEINDLVAWCRAHGRDMEGFAAKTGRTPISVREKIDRGNSGARAAIDAFNAEQRAAKIAEPPPPRPAPDPTNAEILRLERENDGLKDRLKAVEMKLRAVRKEGNVFQQIAGALREIVQPLPACRAEREQSVDSGTKSRNADLRAAGDRTPCDFVLLLSDEHADQQVSREGSAGLEYFDWGIFRCRLQRLRDMTRDYATIHLPRHKPERLWVLLGGDSVHGDIHDHGPLNYFHNTIKATVAVGDAEAQFIQSLIPHFPGGVHVVAVSGNHPRRESAKAKNYDGPLDNYDYLRGVIVASRLGNEIAAGRCSVTLPDSWSAYVEVRNLLVSLNHGDEAQGMGGLPFVSIDRRNNRIQSMLSRMDRRVDIFLQGHWHTAATFVSAGGLSFSSGAFAVTESYAQTKLAASGEPQQHLLVVGDKKGQRGLLLPIPIFLRDEARESAYLAGEWEPELGARTLLDTVQPHATPGLQIVRAS
jgi:hypothetical protein